MEEVNRRDAIIEEFKQQPPSSAGSSKAELERKDKEIAELEKTRDLN